MNFLVNDQKRKIFFNINAAILTKIGLILKLNLAKNIFSFKSQTKSNQLSICEKNRIINLKD